MLQDLNALETTYDTDGRHYSGDRIGEINIGEADYEFEVREFILQDGESRGPTARRVITLVAPDLSAPKDITVLLFPGWGETSAMFEGDFLRLLMKSLAEKNYRNPQIIGINGCGKGTRDYIDNRGKISRVSLEDQLADVRALTNCLVGKQEIMGDIVLVGHSMGGMDALAVLEELQSANVAKALSNTGSNVRRVLNMMPVTDAPLGCVRPRFLKAVMDQVAAALVCCINGKGLDLNREAYERIMFNGNSEQAGPNFERSVPDSARRFLEITLNLWRRSSLIAPADEFEVTTVAADNDGIVPPRMPFDFVLDLGGRGIKVNCIQVPNFPHSVPFRMGDNQKAELEKVFSNGLPSNRR